MTIQQFFDKWNGKFVDYDRAFGNQCTDLMRQYCKEILGVDGYKAIPTTGLAKNIFKNFPDKGNQYFQKIYNTPNGVPKQGDIIFWGWYPTVTGFAGHVAIFDSGDLYKVIAFGQNYPIGATCKFTKYGKNKSLHGYRGVMGWLRRR